MNGKLRRAIIKPGFGIQSRVVARAYGIVPVPRLEAVSIRPAGAENFCHAFGRALRLHKNAELIGWNTLVFMDSRFDMPPDKISAIAARKRACPEAADGSALPITIINHVFDFRF